MENNFLRVVYTINRILATPSVLIMIANRFENTITPEELQDQFYALLEVDMAERGRFQYENTDEVFFVYCLDSGVIQIVLFNGALIELTPIPESERTWNDTPEETQIAYELTQKLLNAIRKVVPEGMKHDFMLTELPSSSNNYLVLGDSNIFSGNFNLVSEPEKTFRFSAAYDVNSDKWDVNYEPIKSRP